MDAKMNAVAESIKDGVGSVVDMQSGDTVDIENIGQDATIEKLGPRRPLAEELAEHSARAADKAEAAREKRIKNPDARVRRLETEKNELRSAIAARDAQLNDLQIAMTRMREEMYQYMGQAQQVAQQDYYEDLPDPEIDPIGAMNYNLSKVADKIQALEEQRIYEQQEQRRQELVSQADRLIAQRVAQNPQEYKAAMDHLAGVVHEHANRNLSHLTSNEKRRAVDTWIKQQKAEWIAQGVNPADALYQIAQDHGFRYGSQNEPEEVDVEEDDNRAAIQRNRRRTANTPTIGGIAGVAPSNLTAGSFMNMNEDQFNQTVNGLIKSGKVRAGRTGGKTPSLQELLPGKAVKF